LTFDEAGRLSQVSVQHRSSPPDPPYRDALDALASQIQEDLAIMQIMPTGHRLAAVHLCFPNHWAAQEKIGRDFATIHAPVAGMERLRERGSELVQLMIGARQGLVRFAWGISWDDQLNHHPQPPPGMARFDRFDPSQPRAFVRVERQTIWGFGECNAALFTIRTYLLDCAGIRKIAGERESLISAVESMSPASLAYKGLSESKDDFLKWMKGGQQ
jgi:hypothetical protein